MFQEVINKPPSSSKIDLFQSVDSLPKKPVELPLVRQVSPAEASNNA